MPAINSPGIFLHHLQKVLNPRGFCKGGQPPQARRRARHRLRLQPRRPAPGREKPPRSREGSAETSPSAGRGQRCRGASRGPGTRHGSLPGEAAGAPLTCAACPHLRVGRAAQRPRLGGAARKGPSVRQPAGSLGAGDALAALPGKGCGTRNLNLAPPFNQGVPSVMAEDFIYSYFCSVSGPTCALQCPKIHEVADSESLAHHLKGNTLLKFHMGTWSKAITFFTLRYLYCYQRSEK